MSSPIYFEYYNDPSKQLIIFETDKGVIIDCTTIDHDMTFLPSSPIQDGLDNVIEMMQRNHFIQRTHPDERWQPEEPHHGLLQQLLSRLDANEVKAGADLVALVKTAYGHTLPDDIEQFLRLVSTRGIDVFHLGPWCMDTYYFEAIPDNVNWFEALMLRDQQTDLGANLIGAFTHSVYMSHIRDADTCLVHLDEDDPNRTEVFYVDHQSRSPKFVSDSFSTFISASTLCEQISAHTEGEYSKALEHHAESLQGKVSTQWPFFEIKQIVGEAGDWGVPPSTAEYLDKRSHWIQCLLNPYLFGGQLEVETCFDDNIHSGLSWERERDHAATSHKVSSALYWLWHLFWFDKDEALRQHIANCIHSPARLVRDAAVLVEELQNGRDTIGNLTDIRATRQAFIQLGLDPEEQEYWQAEKQRIADEKAAKVDAHERAERAKGEAFLAKGSDTNQLTEALWALDTRLQQAPIVNHLLSNDDVNRLRLEAGDYLGLEALSMSRPDLLPALATQAGWLVGSPQIDQKDHTRFLKLAQVNLAAGMEEERKYSDVESVLLALRFVGCNSIVDSVLLPLLQTLHREVDDDFYGFAREATIFLCDVLSFSPNQSVALRDFLIDHWKDFHVFVHPSALKTLAAVNALVPSNEGTRQLVEAFKERQSASTYALAIGGDDSGLALLRTAAHQQAVAAEGVLIHLATAYAEQRLIGKEVDPRLVDMALQTYLEEPHDTVDLWDLAIRCLPANDTQKLLSLLDTNFGKTRHRVIAELRKRDTNFIPIYCDDVYLDSVMAQHGKAGLHDLLDNDHVVLRSNLVEYLRKHDIESNSDATLCEQ